MKSFLFMLVGFCAGVFVGRTIGGQQGANRRSSSPDTRPRPTHQPPQAGTVPAPPVGPPPGEAWFHKQMQAYEDALLAYFISKRCMELNVSANKTMELYQQYGRVPLQPALTEFEAGFSAQGLTITSMGKLAVKWLDGHGITASVDTWEEKATAFLEKRQMEKAETIVSGVLNSN